MKDLIEAAKQFAANLPSQLELLDLAAQQEMALWAKLMFWATAVSVVLSAFAVAAVFYSLRQTRRAIKDTREIGEHQTQAYVHAISAEIKDGRIWVKCKNSGMTPASHFAVNDSVRIVERGRIKESLTFSEDGFKTWTAIGAQQELTIGIDHDWEMVADFHKAGKIGDDVLLVFGQITYCTMFNHDHVTQFAFYKPRGSANFARPVAALKAFSRI